MIRPEQIEKARYDMEIARRKGRHFAYRDLKKHYERLVRQFKKEWGLWN